MDAAGESRFVCPVCREEKEMTEAMVGGMVHEPILALIQKGLPEWSINDLICLACLNRFRTEYIEDTLEEERGELSTLEDEVVESLKEQEVLSKNINIEFERQLTLGQRAADKIATFGGSWRFILIFGVVMVVWISANSVILLRKPFDPYPFILLNLILSCLAAIQAPIIMMSQNRQEDRDRMRAEHDYQINLKAEIEIRLLHRKIDRLLTHQWQRLLEIQRIQTEIMEDVARRRGGK
jgi:uncharacterized membrane protein